MVTPPTSRTASSCRRSFGLLWAAVDLSALGSWILLPTLTAWSYEGRESATTVCIVLLAWFFPAFALRPLASSITNGRNARAIAVPALMVRAAALFPLLSIAANGVTSSLLWALLLSSAAAPFAEASFAPLLRTLVKGGQLAAAEPAMGNGRLFAMIAGGAAATAIYATSATGLLLTATMAAMAAFALSAALLLTARFPEAGGPARSNHPIPLHRGLLLAFRHPDLQTMSAVKVMAALANGGVMVPLVAYMVWGLFVSPGYIGLIVAGQGAGMLVARTTHPALARRYPRSALAASALLLTAAGTFALTMTRTIQTGVAFALVMGAGMGLLASCLSGMAVRLSEEEQSHSVDAGLDWAAEATMLLSIIAVGPLTDALAPRLTLALPAVLLSTLSLFAFGAVVDDEESSGRVYNGEPATAPAADSLKAES